MKKYMDTIWGVAILILCALMFYATSQIRTFAAMHGLDSRFFPHIVAGVLAVLGTILLIRGLTNVKNYMPYSGETKKEHKGLSVGGRCVFETFVAIFIYVTIIDPLGFLLSTVVYLIAQMIILYPEKLTKKKLILFVVISIVASAAIYYIFRNVFYLMLPAGIFG